MVRALQASSENASSKPQNFPDSSSQTLQGGEAPRKALLGENRGQVPAYKLAIHMVCEIQGTTTFGEKKGKTRKCTLSRKVVQRKASPVQKTH